MNIDIKNNQEISEIIDIKNFKNLNKDKIKNSKKIEINENAIFFKKDFCNKQNQKGKLTAFQRINFLSNFDMDENFLETGKFSTHQCSNFDMQKKKSFGDGVITGCVQIQKKKVFIASQDFMVNGGSLGYIHGKKIASTISSALKQGKPIICLNDSGGARIQEGVDALAGYGEIFHLNVSAHHKIPQISVIMGPCAGGAVYSPALTDFVFMVKDTSYMYLTGPGIVKKVTFEDVTHESLGGASVHSSKSGVADFICENDIDALNQLKILLSYLPNNSSEMPPHDFEYSQSKYNKIMNNEYLNHFMPENLNESYDMHNLIYEIIDEGTFFEVKKHFAENLIIGFARIGGFVTGIVANQPNALAGCLDINASLKGEKFIRFCNAFNIPLVSLVDVPGFLPGMNQEYNAVINHGAKLLYAYSEAKVPKITIIVRKAYGGAYIVMNSKHLGANFNFAWPKAQIAVMGADGALELLVKEKTEENNQKFLDEYENLSDPKYAARLGFIDDIIEPSTTRKVICKALSTCFKEKDSSFEKVEKKKESSFEINFDNFIFEG